MKSEEFDMQKNKLNNVIVLKEISSNIVEEAIVVLKPNITLNQEESIETKNPQKRIDKKYMIINEAEDVIKNHILQIQDKSKVKDNEKLERKYKKLKKMSILLAIANLFCIFCLF